MVVASQIPPERQVTFVPNSFGVLQAVWPQRLYRFMLSDGSFVDVLSARDDSDLRAAVLAYTKAERIEGVARLAEPDESEKAAVEPRKVAKRVAVRQKPA